MRTRKIHLVFVCAFLLLDIVIPNRQVSADELNSVDVPLEALHDTKPVELHGLISSQTLNLPVPQTWQVGEGNWLDVQLVASPLLDSARSSLTISLNGLQVTSYRLDKLPRTQQRISIPANMFTQGNNTLTFTGTLYLPGDAQTNCQNWEDPSRWVAINPGGLLHLSLSRRDLQANLSNFPQIFMEPLEKYLLPGTQKQTLIVLPQNSSQDDLLSLSTISYVLGNHGDSNNIWSPEILSGDQLNADTAANRNIIFIGHSPAEFQDQVQNDKDYVALFASPWGIGNAILIIGDGNRQDGFSPALVFSDAARSTLLHGNVAYVERQALPAPHPFPNKVSLEDLGYLDRTVKGIGQQNLIYSLYVPYDVEPVLVKLHLALAHAPDLDILNSAFTVYLNGFSMAGILPSARSATGEPIDVGLPAKKFRRGINFIRIAFDLHVPYSSCERALETVWATVLNSSSLEISYRNHTPIPSLKDFPLPFSDYPSFTYVIPDQFNKKELSYISRLSFMLGNSSYQSNRPPEVMTASNFAQRETDYQNAILVGLPLENSVLRDTNDLLPQPFVEDQNSVQEGYGVYLPTSDREASLGMMQIMPSPWVNGGAVLVLTGNDLQGLGWAWDVILNPTLRGNFSGNLMVVGSANRSQALGGLSASEIPQTLFQQIADASNIPIVGRLLQRSGQAATSLALIAVGTALILILGILWVIRLSASRKLPQALEKTEAGEDEAL